MTRPQTSESLPPPEPTTVDMTEAIGWCLVEMGEIDLIEDIGRVYGYDRLSSQLPSPALRIGRKDRIERDKDRVRDALVGLGMVEVITDGFDNRAWREILGQPDDDLIVEAVNNSAIDASFSAPSAGVKTNRSADSSVLVFQSLKEMARSSSS